MSGKTARRRRTVRRGLAISLAAGLGFAVAIGGAGVAQASTGGAGGGIGGGGGGAANEERRVYLDVYDQVATTYDPATGLPAAGQGWGQDSIAAFLRNAEARIGTDFNGNPMSNGLSLSGFIEQQCNAAIDEAMQRNPDAAAARIVALQFTYQIWTSIWENLTIRTITPADVEPALWNDTLLSPGSYPGAFKQGTWSGEAGDLTADANGDGVYTNAEYVDPNESDPAAQPTSQILQELGSALAEAEAGINGANSGVMVACVAMNNLEPQGLLPTPAIDVSKNAEDVGGVSEIVALEAAGAQGVTVSFTNTGDEALSDVTFTDETTAGNVVGWTRVALPDGSTIVVGAGGVAAALAGVVLAPGETVIVSGSVDVAVGEDHADAVTVTGTGQISGAVVNDTDGTGYDAPAPTPAPSPASPSASAPIPAKAPAIGGLAATGGQMLPGVAWSAFGLLAAGAAMTILRSRRSRLQGRSERDGEGAQR
ncbi:hypothetical protein [Microbacterium sp. RU33B]|uniref:hypothetical protein n=1 Tax=Microbacterium sp. RU33B TaxID=1907390 RepID=UPI000959DBC3|nr:hypothetical protein [Microbacterium sp. RU33B]SIT68198.1 hypothetical protein SAMN05880545_0329 [Microbacterium sp. RU33B]